MSEETTIPKETLSQEDKQALAFAKMRQQMAQKDAEAALAKHEAAQSNYHCALLQLYLKYNLSPEKDAIDEQGNIVRNKEQAK